MAAEKSDQLYICKHTPLEPFQFNQQVASVFDDMAERSIPGYRQLLDIFGSVAPSLLKYGRPNVCYDLGCSLGAASYRLAESLNFDEYGQLTIYAVDKSSAMINALEQSLKTNPDARSVIRPVCADIAEHPLKPCSLVLLYYTLQFLCNDKKQQTLNYIYQSLEPGGWLLMSEKIVSTELDVIDQWQQDFKKRMGYSDLEIAQKRQSLENVMHTDSLDMHVERLRSAGFSSIGRWHQALNFVALAARK